MEVVLDLQVLKMTVEKEEPRERQRAVEMLVEIDGYQAALRKSGLLLVLSEKLPGLVLLLLGEVPLIGKLLFIHFKKKPQE